MGLFDLVVIATHRVTMAAQNIELLSYLGRFAADDIAGVARRATARSVICSPLPAIISGGRGVWTGTRPLEAGGNPEPSPDVVPQSAFVPTLFADDNLNRC